MDLARRKAFRSGFDELKEIGLVDDGLVGWHVVFGANTIGGASDSYIRDIEGNDSVFANRDRGYFRTLSVMARTAGWSTRRSAVIA
jgi:hypothetical protein